MAQKLNAPNDLRAEAGSRSARLSWERVKGADGYILSFFRADDPERCIKTRYSQRTKRLISGFENDCEYLVSVCAFLYFRGREILGERSEKVPFMPHADKLTAQENVCLKTGGSEQIKWEHSDKNVTVTFKSDDPRIAAVSDAGVITAKAAGTTFIRLSASDGQTLRIKVTVDRKADFGSNSAVLMFGGDIMCTAAQQRAAKPYSYDFHEAFSGVKPMLSKADISVGFYSHAADDSEAYELEQPVLPDSTPNVNAPSTMLAAASAAGFNALITSGMRIGSLREATDSNIEKYGMKSISGGYSLFDVRGFRVAVIARDIVGAEDTAVYADVITQARKSGAEFVAVCMNWGAGNSLSVRSSQTKAARALAEAGADIIIGAHPHVPQKFAYIKTQDGRSVPCAFSLGNFLSGMRGMKENRDGAVLRAELFRDGGRASARVSFVPIFQENGARGAVCTENSHPFSEEGKLSLERLRTILGSRAAFCGYRPMVLLSGSAVLGRIFACGNVRTDKTAMLLSPLSLCSAREFSPEEHENPKLALDISKDLRGYIEKTAPDFAAVDFYIPASFSCYKTIGEPGSDPCFFTNTKQLRSSEFFRKNKAQLVRIRPPFGEKLWKPLIEKYAQELLSHIPHDRIILFRCSFGACRVSERELRTVPSQDKLNKLMRDMEDYFISIANPAVVDLSQYYFGEGTELSSYEKAYYSDAYHAAAEIMSGVGRSCVSAPSAELWFARAMKYYDSMTARSYQSRLLDMDNAADKLVAYTSAEFAAANGSRIIKLKQAGKSDLSCVEEFFAGDSGAAELIRAAKIIEALLRGDLNKSYDFFLPAFRGKFAIIRTMVRLLSQETGLSVNENSAELVLLLRGKTQMKRYAAAIKHNTIDIWGSSISRESVNNSKNAFIGKFIFKQPPILASEPAVDMDIPEDDGLFCGSGWRRKNFQGSVSRSGFDVIEDSTSRWIVVDFYDLICRTAEYNGGLFGIDDFICRTDFYKQLQPRPKECYIFEKRDMRCCFEAITRFAAKISEKYGTNIILIKAEPKDAYITLDDRTRPLEEDGMFEIKRKFISLCEERFAGVTGCYVIDISKHFYASDSFPLGGAHIVHYEQEFYRTAGEYIAEIMQGTQRRVFSTVDENYLLLRNLRLQRD